MLRSIRIITLLFAISIAFLAVECDTPLVDRQIEFFATNQSDATVLLFTGEGQLGDFPQELPRDRVVPYAPIEPGQTGYIAIPTGGANVFDELPDRILRIWIFEEEVFTQAPYDSIRLNPTLFELITLTENEYEMMGDTLIIN